MSLRKTSVTYLSDGATTVYSFGFDYISKQFIKVKIDGDDLEYGNEYRVLSNNVTLTNVCTANAVITIYRETPTTRLVSWLDGSILRAGDMTLNQLQQLHIAEETSDKVQDSGLAKDSLDGVWDGRFARMKNISDPVYAQDVVNKRYFESTQVGYIQASQSLVDEATNQKNIATVQATNSATSASKSLVSETNAKTSETNAKASETNAKTSETNAKVSEASALQSEKNAYTHYNNALTEANRSKAEASNSLFQAERSKQYADAVATGVVIGEPIGTVHMWSSLTIPNGYLECNGQVLTKTAYPELYANIGYGYGGSGENFNLPDLRGEFVRGLDRDRGVDSESYPRTIGSKQSFALHSHYHVEAVGYTNPADPPASLWGTTSVGVNGYSQGDGYSTARFNTSATGGTETRPRNVALMFIIKVKNVVGVDPAVIAGNAMTLGGLPQSAFALTGHTHPTGVVTVITGTVGHGGYVPIPAGYTQSQCAWIVSPYNYDTPNFDVNEGGYQMGFRFRCWADANRLVTATHGFNVQGEQACVAQYICIGVK